MNKYTNKAAKAFWSSTRKQFLPCTVADIANRSGLTPNQSGRALSEMLVDNLLTAETSNNSQLYFLTPKGREFVEGLK